MPGEKFLKLKIDYAGRLLFKFQLEQSTDRDYCTRVAPKGKTLRFMQRVCNNPLSALDQYDTLMTTIL